MKIRGNDDLAKRPRRPIRVLFDLDDPGSGWKRFRHELWMTTRALAAETQDGAAAISHRENNKHSPQFNKVLQAADSLGYEVVVEWRPKVKLGGHVWEQKSPPDYDDPETL